MKLNLSPLVIAIAMTATTATSTFLRSKTSDGTIVTLETTKKHLSTARQGEIMVEIDHTAGDDLSEECRMILIDAFSDSFSQVYGVDGMHALIESEQTFPNRDAKQANLQYYGAQWRVYWVSVSGMSPSQHRCVCASPIERHLTNFCFRYPSSSCL